MVNILIYLLILAVTNIFGIFNILEDYRIPGVGKPSDFILILLVLVVIIKLLKKKVELTSQEKKLNKIALVIVIYVFFLTIYSSIITDRETFNYSLRTAAPYLYYISFLFPIYLITNERQLIKFINFLRIGGFITGIIALISNLVGFSIASGAYSLEQGSYVRVYLPLFFNFFVVVFWAAQYLVKNKFELRIYYWEMIISALGIALFLGRTNIIVVLLALLYLIWFMSKSSTKAKRRTVYLFVLFVSGLILSFILFNFNPTGIIERFQTGYEGTLGGTSTFSYRLLAIAMGYNVFEQTPIFGTGFIHPTSSYYSHNLITYIFSPVGYPITNNNDFGLASILFTTGIIGFVLITYFVVKNLYYIKVDLNKMVNNREFNTIFFYSLTMFITVLFIFFIEQLSGNEFGNRNIAIYAIALGFAVKFLPENSENDDLQNRNSLNNET